MRYKPPAVWTVYDPPSVCVMSTGVPAGNVAVWPAGICTALQSRLSSTEVLVCMRRMLRCFPRNYYRKSFSRSEVFHLNLPVRNAVWQQAIEASADPPLARQGFDRLKATEAAAALKKASPEQARILAALFSGSQALGELLLKHPDWLVLALDTELLRHPRQEQGLRREVNS